MSDVEQELSGADVEAFDAICRSHGFAISEFDLTSIGLQPGASAGSRQVTVTRHSTHDARDYPVGSDGAWLRRFSQDLVDGCFGPPAGGT